MIEDKLKSHRNLINNCFMSQDSYKIIALIVQKYQQFPLTIQNIICLICLNLICLDLMQEVQNTQSKTLQLNDPSFHLQATLTYTNNIEESQLTLILANTQTQQTYDLTINQTFINEHQQLATAVGNTKKMFQVLGSEGVKVDIKEDGVIVLTGDIINIQFKTIKRLDSQTTIIQTKYNELAAVIKLQQLLIQSMQNSFKTQMDVKTKQLNSITQLYNGTRQELDLLKKQREQSSESQLKIQQLFEQLSQQKQQFKCFQHPYNPHSFHFNLHLLPNSLKIIKSSDNSYHNFISNLPIPKGQITTFKIKQTRITDGYLYQGVGTKAVFGDINCWNKDYISYYSGDGDVCLNGSYREGGEPIVNGQIVTIKVDRQGQRVSWKLDEDDKQLQVIIPEHMRDQQLFLVLLMKHKGDELELMLD